MRSHIRIALATGALALLAAPMTASAVTYTPTPGPKYKPAPPPPPPAHAKAHGKRCQGKSKKHVKGQKGTEFSRCVKAQRLLRKARNNPHMPPGRVCKNESKEHVKGQKGTAFSRCVKMVAHLRREERRKEREEGKVSGATISAQPEGVPKGKGPEYVPDDPGVGEAPPAHAKAHGKRCQGKSKEHVKGEQGTEFSRCVRALAKAEDHPGMHPRKACKGLSRKHVKGEKGTEFSRCVKEVAQLRREERRKEREGAAA
jgi:hypothetical protein